MNFTLLSSLFTLFSMLVFIGIVCWAYSRDNRDRFEALGHLPPDEAFDANQSVSNERTMQAGN